MRDQPSDLFFMQISWYDHYEAELHRACYGVERAKVGGRSAVYQHKSSQNYLFKEKKSG